MFDMKHEAEREFPTADLLKGVSRIAKYLDESERRTYYLLEKKYIPGFKIGSIWHSRKSRLNQRYSGDAA